MTKKRVLVVDDSQFLTAILSSTLQGAGFEVRVAGTVKEAVQSLRTEGIPDLLVLDLNLPDLPGDQACKAIRKAPACADLPIVLISGASDEVLAKAAGQVQASGWLKKPFSPSSILRWIREHAELLESAPSRSRSAPSGETSDSRSTPTGEAPTAPKATPASSAPAATVKPASAPLPPHEGEASPGGVLVIEDSNFLRSVLRDVLGAAGYKVALTRSIGEGTALLKRYRPGLVLLDVNLPDMQGDEACAILKQVPDCRGIPIVLMTSGTEEALAAKAKAAGADGWLRKPFTPESLLAWIRSQKFPLSVADDSGTAGGTPGLEGLLVRQLTSTDAGIRAQAAYGIGEQGFKNALTPLRGLLQDQDPGVVADVLWSLGRLEDLSSLPLIESLLRTPTGPGQDPNVRLRAIEALGRMKDKRSIQTIALCLAEDRPKDERIVAIHALADLGDETVRDYLQRILFEDEGELQSLARSALERIATRSAPPKRPGT